MEEKIDLVKLRSMLPHGYSKILQYRIKKKKKKEYTTHSIRRGLTEKFANEMIIAEAILYAEELEIQRSQRNIKLKSM